MGPGFMGRSLDMGPYSTPERRPQALRREEKRGRPRPAWARRGEIGSLPLQCEHEPQIRPQGEIGTSSAGDLVAPTRAARLVRPPPPWLALARCARRGIRALPRLAVRDHAELTNFEGASELF